MCKGFKGSIVALITPMDTKGKVDRTSLKKLVDYHVACGTAAIVSVGTTGESATLNREEHVDAIMQTVELSKGRIPVIAGTGSNSTADAISLTERLEDVGVAGCLTVTPYYNKPTQKGLFQHFKAIAESTNLPQILYNVPARTGCDMLPETIAQLSTIKNIVAVKEATGDLNRVLCLQAMIEKGLIDDKSFTLLSGDDATGLDFMQLGGKGIISVTANVAAVTMVKVCRLAADGKFTEARQLNKELMPLHHGLFVESNPIPVKWACKEVGLITTDALRLPLTPLADTYKPMIKKALESAGWFKKEKALKSAGLIENS